jgi:multiple sugar transport system ATP-binding protein
MAEVRFKDVKKQYGDLTVIEHLDLDIRAEEFMVLVGPSGCGKSTALRMIAGLEEITAGTIEIGGRVVNDVAPKDRDIAMVFQSYALYPHMSVRQNLEFGLKLKKTPKAEMAQRVDEAAEILGLSNLLDRKPRQLSGGQRQRVAVGRAIVRKPAVFLFDEPLSNLDAKLRVQMRAEITKLQQRLKTTTVYVTHDQVEAMTMGHRIAIMSAGDLMQVGTPRQVYEQPANVFVAQFIGTPPMNLLTATVSAAGDALEAAAVRLPVAETLRGVVAGHHGKKVVVGLRPENLVEAQRARSRETAPVTVDVEVVEPLGNEVIVFGRLGDDLVAAKLEPDRTPRFGDRLELVAELDQLHLFDAESEQRLAA